MPDWADGSAWTGNFLQVNVFCIPILRLIDKQLEL